MMRHCQGQNAGSQGLLTGTGVGLFKSELDALITDPKNSDSMKDQKLILPHAPKANVIVGV
jgi:hypothetical protein